MSRPSAGPPTPERPRTFLNDQMRAIDREVTRRAAAAVERSGVRGLSPAHGRLMAELDPKGSRPSELADRLGVTKAAVGQLAAKLEQKGLVARSHDPQDGRAVRLRPTDRAEQGYRAARAEIIAIEAEWESWLGPTALRSLERSIRRLGAWAQRSPSSSSRPHGRQGKERRGNR